MLAFERTLKYSISYRIVTVGPCGVNIHTSDEGRRQTRFDDRYAVAKFLQSGV